MFHVPEKYRVTSGLMGSTAAEGNNGAFMVPFRSYGFFVVASDGLGWEHVSVSLKNRTPNWEEMSFFKDLFWDPEDCVVQFHPPKSEHVNNHPHCLHLWRMSGENFPRPVPGLVGSPGVGPLLPD